MHYVHVIIDVVDMERLFSEAKEMSKKNKGDCLPSSFVNYLLHKSYGLLFRPFTGKPRGYFSCEFNHKQTAYIVRQVVHD